MTYMLRKTKNVCCDSKSRSGAKQNDLVLKFRKNIIFPSGAEKRTF